LNRKENKQMLRRIIVGALLLSLALIIVGCSGPTSNPTPSGPIKATLIEPQVVGDTISVPVSEVEDKWNTHFRVETQDGNMTFMAYTVGGEIYVRANICPPCHSTKTGVGISGACVGYPKAAVAYEISDGNIVMKSVDLITAYQDTIEPG
jgi:hypothetical protein